MKFSLMPCKFQAAWLAFGLDHKKTDLILEKSKITQKGKLTPRFDYLQDFLID